MHFEDLSQNRPSKTPYTRFFNMNYQTAVDIVVCRCRDEVDRTVDSSSGGTLLIYDYDREIMCAIEFTNAKQINRETLATAIVLMDNASKPMFGSSEHKVIYNVINFNDGWPPYTD
jgi:hypothetical protein